MLDEPLLSPRRIAQGVALWLWFMYRPVEPVYIPLRKMLLYHRRPYACHLKWDKLPL